MKGNAVLCRCIAMMLSVIMTVSLLTGCDLVPPSDVDELMARANDSMIDIESYSMSVRSRIEFELSAEYKDVTSVVQTGVTGSVQMVSDVDILGDKNHGGSNVTIEADAVVSHGANSQHTNEVFASNIAFYHMPGDDESTVLQYTNVDDAGWHKSKISTACARVDMNQIMSTLSTAVTTSVSRFESVDDGYLVSVRLFDMLSVVGFSDVMLACNEIAGGLLPRNISWVELSSCFGDGLVVYKFDKACRLVEMRIENVILDIGPIMNDAHFISDDELLKFEIIQMVIAFDNFDGIMVYDVTVPDDVISEAIEFGKVDN